MLKPLGSSHPCWSCHPWSKIRPHQSLLRPTVPSDPRSTRSKISSLRSSNLCGVKFRLPLIGVHPCRSCHPWSKIRPHQSLLRPTLPSGPRSTRFKISSLRSSNLSGVKFRQWPPLKRTFCHEVPLIRAGRVIRGQKSGPTKAFFVPLSHPAHPDRLRYVGPAGSLRLSPLRSGSLGSVPCIQCFSWLIHSGESSF